MSHRARGSTRSLRAIGDVISGSGGRARRSNARTKTHGRRARRCAEKVTEQRRGVEPGQRLGSNLDTARADCFADRIRVRMSCDKGICGPQLRQPMDVAVAHDRLPVPGGPPLRAHVEVRTRGAYMPLISTGSTRAAQGPGTTRAARPRFTIEPGSPRSDEHF